MELSLGYNLELEAKNHRASIRRSIRPDMSSGKSSDPATVAGDPPPPYESSISSPRCTADIPRDEPPASSKIHSQRQQGQQYKAPDAMHTMKSPSLGVLDTEPPTSDGMATAEEQDGLKKIRPRLLL
ncbi:hypothetical protein VTK56DRAFT_8325 [Thermocarpiscus australiensis]